METAVRVSINDVLCIVYVLLTACLNCAMYLIASFYRKKFNQPAPRTGFIIALIFIALYIMGLFLMDSFSWFQLETLRIVRTIFLIVSAIFTGWSSINLLIIMKKTKK